MTMHVLVIISAPSDMPAFDEEAVWYKLPASLATYERLVPATEKALRERLATSSADVLHYIGYVEWRHSARYGTLAFCGWTGATRRLAMVYLSSLLAEHSMRLVVSDIANMPDEFPPDLYQPTAAPAPPTPLQSRPESLPISVTSPPDDSRQQLRRKRDAQTFDVFLCHHSVDKPRVREIAGMLEQRGILPWLDERELRPGLPWEPALEHQIENIGAAAVFVGAAGIGPWQQQEIYSLLHGFTRRGSPVIPVLLPDATAEPSLPLFLQLMTWVDFRRGGSEALDRLIWGITGTRPF